MKLTLLKSIEENEVEIIGDIKNIINKRLPIKYKSLSYKEFKQMFNLKGSKKLFIENCPEGFYIDIQ